MSKCPEYMSKLNPDLVESSILVMKRSSPSLVPIAMYVSSFEREMEEGK